jgi:alpha-beta hydrolase superfamily lysophospholipase
MLAFNIDDHDLDELATKIHLDLEKAQILKAGR